MTEVQTTSAQDGGNRPAGTRPQLAVVVPVHNEADNIETLITEIAQALDGRFDFEIVYVDDASTDATADTLAAAAKSCAALRIVRRHRQRSGQSAAVATGVTAEGAGPR